MLRALHSRFHDKEELSPCWGELFGAGALTLKSRETQIKQLDLHLIQIM